MSEAEVLISSCFFFFFSISIIFERPDPERKTQSKKIQEISKPILILTESNNSNFKVLDAPEHNSLGTFRKQNERVHPTIPYRPPRAYGLLSWSMNIPLVET